MVEYCTECECTELELIDRKQVSTDMSGAKWYRETSRCVRCGHLEVDYAIEPHWQLITRIQTWMWQLAGQIAGLRRELEFTVDSFARWHLKQAIAGHQAMLDAATEQIEAAREGQVS